MSKIINGEYAPDFLSDDEVYDIVGVDEYRKIKNEINDDMDEEGKINPDVIVRILLNKTFGVSETDAFNIVTMFKRIYSIY